MKQILNEVWFVSLSKLTKLNKRKLYIIYILLIELINNKNGKKHDQLSSHKIIFFLQIMEKNKTDECENI